MFATESSRAKIPTEGKLQRAEAKVGGESLRANPVWQSLSLRSGVIQPKLSVSQPDDPFEREADRVADQVTGAAGPQVQRSCACGGECADCATRNSSDERVRMQTNHASAASTSSASGADLTAAPPIVNDVLRSPGQPLDAETRGFMESRFVQDFAHVRVHTGAKAAESAQAVNARAYTVGSDIVLGAGQHASSTVAGRKLLAHELTHVVQQSSGLQRKIIQRWAINKCTTSQSVYIEDAFAKSFDDLSKVAKLMNQKPTTERVKNAMWLAFRDDSEATVEKVRANINLMKSKITSASITCMPSTDADCATDTGFHSRRQGDYGEIYLCMPTFSDKGPVEQANILTHEATHKYLNVRDTGYFNKGCEETQRRTPAGDEEGKDSGTAGDNPAMRLNNADAYTCFVHFLVRVRAEGLATKATEFRGDNLKLEAPEEYVYTKTAAPSRATFRLTGAPENSGFRFKWKLVAGEEEFRLESSRSLKLDTEVFDEDTLDVYVSKEVRAKLGEKKIREAVIRCTIELYRPTAKEAAPEITRTLPITVHEGQDPSDPTIM